MATQKQKSFPTPDLRPLVDQYSEFKPLAQELADHVCREINKRAPAIKSTTPYKCQAVLEELIKILQSRV